MSVPPIVNVGGPQTPEQKGSITAMPPFTLTDGWLTGAAMTENDAIVIGLMLFGVAGRLITHLVRHPRPAPAIPDEVRRAMPTPAAATGGAGRFDGQRARDFTLARRTRRVGTSSRRSSRSSGGAAFTRSSASSASVAGRNRRTISQDPLTEG